MNVTDQLAEKVLDHLIAQDKVWGVMVHDIKAALQAALADVPGPAEPTSEDERRIEQLIAAMWAMHRDMKVLLESWDRLAADMTRLKRPDMADGIALCARQLRIFLELHE